MKLFAQNPSESPQIERHKNTRITGDLERTMWTLELSDENVHCGWNVCLGVERDVMESGDVMERGYRG